MGCGGSTHVHPVSNDVKEDEDEKRPQNAEAPAEKSAATNEPTKEKEDRSAVVTVLQDTDDQENKVKERKPQPTVHSKAGPSANGSERSIPGSYLTDEEEETIKDWLKNVDVDGAVPLEDTLNAVEST
jgi:hypothetical protein